jgi:PAS domain S-box-containing protein
MAQLLIFSAFLQAVIITFFLGTKVTRKDLPALLQFFLTINYTCVLFSGFWNTYSIVPLTRLHIPIGFAAGPVFYFFVKFSFLPIKNTSNRWLWWFLPFVIEVTNAIFYWILYAFNSPLTAYLREFSNILSRLGFLYFVLFFIAGIVFIVRHNTVITMNIVYKRQLKLFKVFIFFVILFILDETFTSDNEIFFSSLIACAFTSTFLYFLLNDVTISSKLNREGKELLKEALNERQKAVVIMNQEGTIEYVNEPFLTIIGYRHRDVIGRKFTFLHGDLTTQESKDFISEQLAMRLEFIADIIHYRKNGEAFICNITMIPVFSNDELTHFIAYEEYRETISEAAPQDDELAILEKIKSYFQTSESYKNKQLQLSDVSEALGIPARRVSEILKKCEDYSFSEFVNTYRVQAVVKMLQNIDNQNLTIEAMSQICGFNSKSVFHAAFKKKTGKTPKAFLEEIQF